MADETGGVLPGATVTVRNEGTDAAREVLTNAHTAANWALYGQGDCTASTAWTELKLGFHALGDAGRSPRATAFISFRSDRRL